MEANWLPLEFSVWFISIANGSSNVNIFNIFVTLPFLSPAPVPVLLTSGLLPEHRVEMP